MADSLVQVPPRGRDGPRGDDDDDADVFSELRSLIVGPEQRELLELQAHVLDPSVQTRDVSRVLPDAIALRASDPQLMRALAPSIEEAVAASVRRDPRPLADALFPVIGPAIRKAIAHTLAAMMESMNRTVEHSISLRALRWRWTAFQTGKPFAEIVLLNTLEYRVEQVFLIHRETGLLLLHLGLEDATRQDADQISAMLTAIRDFVQDSFRTSGADTLDALRVGDVSVSIEQGPHAVLAAVVRGTAPRNLQTVFQDALEAVHRQFGLELEAFHGDAAPFERARPILESCLVTQLRPRARRASYRWLTAAVAVVLLLAGAWAFFAIRDRQRWNAYVGRLRAEPGIVVVSAGRRDGRFFVGGLRDALATDPAALIGPSKLSASAVASQWEPYQSLYPAFVVARARDLLRPPSGVTLDYRDGVLTASGAAPGRWILDSERLAPAIAGVRRFEYTGTSAEARLKNRIEGMGIRFPKGQSRIAPGQEATIREIADLLSELNDTLRFHGQRARVEIVGHTDADGSDFSNGPLSQARAAAVAETVRSPLLDAIDLATTGIGSAAPLSPGTSESDKQQNRRASFRVSLPAAAPPGDRRP
jgi:outer membrane protein OmpA-like peptidoglycan-associated protein